MTTTAPASPIPPAPSGGMPGWLKGVLIGCGGLIFLCVLAFAGFTWFIVHKAKQAGLDPELMRTNPALAVTKMITTFNPDLEVVKVDDSRGTITVRDKREGKVLTINMEDAKKGKFVFQEEGKEAVTLETRADGGSGSVDIKSTEGSVHIGAGGKAPEWIPAYPGAAPEGTFSSQSDKVDTGSFHFATQDPVDKVAAWYAAELKKAGQKVTSNTMQQDGRTSAGFVGGEAAGGKRKVSVAATFDGSSTSVVVTYETKK